MEENKTNDENVIKVDMNKPNLKKASDDVIKVDLSAKPDEDDKP
jgi:hypothetical protein